MIETPGYKYLADVRRVSYDVAVRFGLGSRDALGHSYFPASVGPNVPELDSRFDGSVLFPIFDVYGRTVGVSARKLDPSAQPKYVNTVYAKSKHLYGLHLAWPTCLGEQVAYVVEGNVDTVMAHQVGLFNTVGMLGSAFSFTQMCLLLRFVKYVVVVPDGDAAGRRLVADVATAARTTFASSGLEFYYKPLPDGYDPDKFLRERSLTDFLSIPNQRI